MTSSYRRALSLTLWGFPVGFRHYSVESFAIATFRYCSNFIYGGLIKKQCCPPGHLGVDQLRGILFRYFQQKPEKRYQAAADIAISALVEAFPCQWRCE